MIPERWGAEIGNSAGDRPDLHMDMVSLLRAGQPANADEARAMVQEALQDDWIAQEGEQQDMFGGEIPKQSLMIARARINTFVLRELRKEARVFGQLTRNADAIEAGGNVLARDSNEAQAAQANVALNVLSKLSTRHGEWSEAYGEAARRVLDGEAVASAGRGVLTRVKNALASGERFEAGRAATLDPRPPGAHAQAMVKDFDEPGGAGAQAQIASKPEEAMLERGRSASTDQTSKPSAEELDPEQYRERLAQLIADQPHDNVGALYAHAQAHQAELAQAARQIAERTGAEFRDPGLKDRTEAEEKIGRKGYDSARQLTDVVRGGFVVDTPQVADRVASQLAQRFDVLDEGWGRSPTGYSDRKLLVRFADGSLGEVQLWSRDMYAAKMGEGGRLYTARRGLPPDSPEARALLDREKNVYAAARTGDWSDAFGGDSGPNIGSNPARQSASVSRRAVWLTSAKSTFDHEAPGLSSAQAEVSNSTAGRLSQSTNFIGDPSAGDHGGEAAAAQGAEEALPPGLFDDLPDDRPEARAIERLSGCVPGD